MFDNNTFWDMMSKGMRDGTGLTSASWGESTFAWLDQVLTKGHASAQLLQLGLLRQSEG